MALNWPHTLWIVRHGESAGNLARDRAQAEGASRIALEGRDVDVPLSPLGEEQSRALGRWFGDLPEDGRPEAILCSPYLRARHTAELIAETGRLPIHRADFVVDERLREKKFGVLDGLTGHGIRQVHPDQAEFRRLLGKFYHRPPGGESWCDVILRLRSALDTISLHYAGRRVLIVGHQVVVLCMRYLLERMSEDEILAVDREGDVPNCGVTEYAHDPAQGAGGGLVLRRYNFVAPMLRAGTPVTAAPDARAAAS
ncbi:histidine phosphatase family protein [Roseomonas sp. CCTCC AB2023176]|uniref:histidine phosphatase family protein n=1 Tax=Roseomonas sp. CCTCC AB2023176 TaxID=3342640 RepID=UPI0035DA9D14